MSIILDFVTTATNRVDIIEECYQSFTTNLLDVDFKNCTLYINVDPIPKLEGSDPIKLIKMCRKYFGAVIINIPEKPNYTQAYKWLYANAKTKLIFNLEDDWIIKEKISINVLLKYFDEIPELYAACFRAYPHRYISIPTSPQVLHKRFYKIVGEGLNPTINPEIQLRADKIPGIILPNKRPEHGIAVTLDGKCVVWPIAGGNDNIVVADIGRKWIDKQSFKKPDSKEGFITWEEK